MLKFIEVKFTQRKISNFKVNTSAAFSTFTMLRNCHLDLVPNRLHHPKTTHIAKFAIDDEVGN